jgi:serine-type D-Ala-D-Ala carboxypeptidase/endopeptidase (penicillin-binding protein 4)
MSNIFTALCLYGLLSGAVIASDLPEAVTSALKHEHIPLSSVAVVVQEVNAGAPLISLNAGRSMNPASTMKLLTTFAALETLGPAYRWKTEAYLDGKLEDGVLQGDLVFKGYGDPKLTVEQFWMWLRELRQRGLREIRGDVVLDHSYFEEVSQDPAEFDNDPTRAYNVGTSALLLNFNVLHLHLIPNGHETIALLEPSLDGYTLVNRITTSGKMHCGGEDAYRVRLDGHDILLEGKIPAACGEADNYLSLLPQDEYFFAVFSSLWKELGGTLHGKLRTGTIPPDQAPFAKYISPPLSEVIRDINKFSNNIMARQLFLTLGTASPAMSLANSTQAGEDKQHPDDEGKHDALSNPQEFGVSGSTLLTEQIGGDTAEKDSSVDQPLTGLPEVRESAGGTDPARPGIAGTQVSGVPVSGTPNDTKAVIPPANIARSKAAMQQWLKVQQLQFPELVLENGAGLSRKERISPAHLAELLQRATNSPFFAELEASLPILGMDGTVKKRFKDNGIAGYAHLKTGSLEGVKSIAGYVQAHSGKQWIVVSIINHPNAARAQPAQDALIDWLQTEN